MRRIRRNDHHIPCADTVRLTRANQLAAFWRSSCGPGGSSPRSDECLRAAHDDDHGGPILMGMQLAFIGFATAFVVGSPRVSLSILSSEQVLAVGLGLWLH